MKTLERGDQVWYRCVSDSECDECFYSLKTDMRYDLSNSDHKEWLGELIGLDFHAMHDGWQSSWPLAFSIHEIEGGPELYRVFVSLHSEPVFSATLPKDGGEE